MWEPMILKIVRLKSMLGMDLAKDIKQNCGNVELIFSTIVIRIDVLSLKAKIDRYNSLLVKICSEQQWGLINNNNLAKDHLNDYGLHLNKNGSAQLAMNIKTYLNGN